MLSENPIDAEIGSNRLMQQSNADIWLRRFIRDCHAGVKCSQAGDAARGVEGIV